MDTPPLEAPPEDPAVTWHTAPRPRRRARPAMALALCAAALVACAGPSPLSAQAAADQAVQRGLVGAVFEHLTAETQERGIAGQRRLAPAAPLLGTERMMLESCSKAMTGMIAARIIEEGSIDWSTTLEAALPDLAATMRPEYRSVTLEALLAHRGGVAAFTESADVEPFLAYVQGFAGTLPGDETARRRFFVAWLLQRPPPPQVTPGQTFLYSNAGFAVAAAMLEAATGKAWEVLFDEELLKPLGVSASFGAPTLGSAVESVGYTGPSGTRLAPAVLLTPDEQAWWDVLRPAGGVAMAPQDYAAWLRWHLKGLKGQPTPLPTAYLDRLRSLTAGAYAVGWGGGKDYAGRRRATHAGAGTEGYQSAVELFLDGGDADFALTNTFYFDARGASWVMDELLGDLMSMRASYLR